MPGDSILKNGLKTKDLAEIERALKKLPNLNVVYTIPLVELLQYSTPLQAIIVLRSEFLQEGKPAEDIARLDAMIDVILDRERELNIVTKNGTDLMYAIEANDTVTAMKILSKKPNINISKSMYDPIQKTSYLKSALLVAVDKKNIEIVKALLADESIDLYAVTDAGTSMTVFGRILYSRNIPAIKEVLKKGVDLTRKISTNFTALMLSVSVSSKEIFDMLLEAGADVNQMIDSSVGENVLLYAARHAPSFVEHILAAGANPSYKDTNGKTAADYVTDPDIKARLLSAIDEYNEKQPKWAGWTRSDIDKLNTIFEMDAQFDETGQLKKARPANDYACCPVCLEYVEREEACMYMKHKCHDPTNPKKFYHKELYNKYKNPAGEIYWCTICGRIALGHKHYALVLPDKPVPELLPSGNPFAIDCRATIDADGILKTHNGGGLPEKAMRFRRLREYALLLDNDVGKKTEEQALRELVEAMWKAPLEVEHVPTVEGILATKKWNISPTKFRADVVPVAENTVQTFWPDVLEDEKNKHTIVKEDGVIAEDPLSGEGNQQIYHFSYPGESSNAGPHANEKFGKPGLLGLITHYNENHGMENFGKCIVVGCPTKIHPNVIRDLFLDKSEPDPTKRAEYINAYIIYRKHYNRRFPDKKKDGHKSNFRFPKGARHNVFSKADDAACVVDDEFAKEPMRPQDGGRKRMHKRQTHKMRGRKTRNGKHKMRARKTRDRKHKHRMLRVRITRKAK